MLRRKVLSLGAAGAFLAASGLAFAQETTTPPPAPPPAAEPAPAAPPAAAPAPAPSSDVAQPAPAPAAAAGKEEKTEEITVTGTRIRRKDLSTPAPVTVINREQLAASGKVSIGDFLQALPEQGNAINTGVNNSGDGSTRVNLRGIGSQRTLVLVNGRRWMPGGLGADSSADLNSIPTAVIERIEILKDGASAVYGSDAIAGVVNIITRRGGNRTDASAYTGTSSHGDGTTFDLNLTTGTGSDRGNVLFSAGYYDQRKTMADKRSWSEIPYGYDGTTGNAFTLGSGTIPAGRTLATDATGNALWTDLKGAGGSSFIWDPAKTADPAAGIFCGTSNGAPQCFRRYKGSGLNGAGDGYNFEPDNYLLTPQQRLSLFTTGDAQFGIARGFFEASYVNRKSSQNLAPEPLNLDAEGVQVSAQNAYNPFGTDVFVRRRLSEFGRRITNQDIDTFRVLGGVDGTLPDSAGPLQGWFWDLTFNYGRTQGVQEKLGNLYIPNLAASLGPTATVNGVLRCSTDGTAAGVIDGCVPLNLFGGPGAITPDQVANLTFDGTSRGQNTLTAFQANTSGELFRLLADRPVGLAAGYEFRKVQGSYIYDPITEKGLTTGNKGTNTAGGYNVNEVYGELSVPILSGMPLIEDLEATAAIRWFDYSNFGSDSTYKFGARYRPIRDVTVRGTYSTAFRAPSISDLYLGRSDNFASVKDPCAGASAGSNPVCTAQGVPAGGSGDVSTQLHSTVGGNPDLKPETANIYTVGLVIEPRYVKGLSITLDYYNMEIKKNISTLGESVILAGCYSGRNPEYCGLITRDPTTHFISNILNLNANVGTLKTAGLDFAARYTLPTAVAGRFGFAFDGTWLQKIDQTLADGRTVKGRNTFDLWALNSAGGLGGSFPEWKFNAGLTWALGGLGAGVNTRFIGPFHECGDNTGDFSGAGLCYEDSTYQRKVSAWHAEDLFVSYGFSSVAGKTNLMVGVSNVFDMAPVRIYNAFISQADVYNYDVMGRFYYVRLAQTY